MGDGCRGHQFPVVWHWDALGGQGLHQHFEAGVVTGDDDTASVFNAGVFGGDAPATGPSAFAATDNVEASNYVDKNPGAIAYVGFAFKRGQKPLTLVSECGIGSTPDAFSVKTEEYNLFRRLYLYNRGDLSDQMARDFVSFATSDDANGVITQSGFINLGVERVEMGLGSARAREVLQSGTNASEQRLANDMLTMLANNDRLSSTFRFRTGSAILDQRAESDLTRLVHYLADAPAGTQVTFVGFADSMGDFGANLSLAQARAAQVQSALEAASGGCLSNVTFTSTGFGELSPAACNSSDSGRQINRRVETWISTQ